MINKFYLKPSNVFDILFIFSIPFFSVLFVYLSLISELSFYYILKANVIFLGYHHVISTYTRITFSLQDFKQNKFLIVYLPLLVFPAVFLLIEYVGVWAISTLYLYWQWFHYTRQSFGISRFYQKTKGNKIENEIIAKLSLYLLPLAGIFYRSYQNPDTFLELHVKTLPIPYFAFITVLLVALICIAIQILSWIKLFFKGELNNSYVYYIISHHVIFAVGYLLVEDITIGWLCINIWHNAQYIFFVWFSNNKRFKKGYNKRYGYISKISQKENLDMYILICLLVTVCYYFLLSRSATFLDNYTSLPLMILFFMSINFHHYIVDGIIWKKNYNKIINAPEYLD